MNCFDISIIGNDLLPWHKTSGESIWRLVHKLVWRQVCLERQAYKKVVESKCVQKTSVHPKTSDVCECHSLARTLISPKRNEGSPTSLRRLWLIRMKFGSKSSWQSGFWNMSVSNPCGTQWITKVIQFEKFQHIPWSNILNWFGLF